MDEFIVGQRVIVSGAIGYAILPETSTGVYHNPLTGKRERVAPHTLDGWKQMWVYVPTLGFASCYDRDNVKPLPGGQL